MKLYRSSLDFVLNQNRSDMEDGLPAISLFSGAGLGDLGYLEAGFSFVVQAEKDIKRATLCQRNLPNSECVIGDLGKTTPQVINIYKCKSNVNLALLCITPPCQGMSSSNSGRGKSSDPQTSDSRNTLLLDALPIIVALKPRIIVIENVPQLLQRMIHFGDRSGKLLDIFEESIQADYHLFSQVVQLADYGVPQDRKRAVLVAIRNDEPSLKFIIENDLLPLPRRTHAKQSNGKASWISLGEWLRQIIHAPLDAISKDAAKDKSDLMHFVPSYTGDRYLMVADIPQNSGKSAYQNSICHKCKKSDVPEGEIYCPDCRAPMTNRPYVVESQKYRLIKGFKSSYRRMYPDRPAATITTSSSHIGSDYKIHPWENRVLSIRECADLQTIPRYYDWSWVVQTNNRYVARQVVGEALPPWFTYQHGLLISKLLKNLDLNPEEFEPLRK